MVPQKNNKPFVSIIIVCEDWNDYLEESLPYHLELNYINYEVVIVSTKKINKKIPRVKFVTAGKLKFNPATKRDLGTKNAKGEIYAFIDDDAFPDKNWLKKGVEYFSIEGIAAVGGPGITPEYAPFMQHASGWVSASPIGGFGSTHRFIPQPIREVDDFPSMNLIVQADAFNKAGGFDSNYYPGDDTKLCLNLTSKLGMKIIYDPEILVHHHKRSLFKKHLIQIGRYGYMRGLFARILPETSRRFFYFVPSLFVAGLIGGIFLIIARSILINVDYYTLINKEVEHPSISRFIALGFGFADFFILIYLAIVVSYLILLIMNSWWVYNKTKNLKLSLIIIPGVIATHVWYGIRFAYGFIKKDERTFGQRID